MDDLVLICPDRRWKAVLEAFLERSKHLGIRDISSQVYCLGAGGSKTLLAQAAAIAEQQVQNFNHCLILLDADRAGDERDPIEVEASVREVMGSSWEGRASAIVASPSLEAWLLEAHRVFARVPGLRGVDVRQWLSESGLWPMDEAQPDQARHAMERLFDAHDARMSAASYRMIAAAYPFRFDRIENPSIRRFIHTLRDWFSA